MKSTAILFPLAVLLVGGCTPSGDSPAPPPQNAQTTTTRWKWTPETSAGIPQGIIIDQAGEKVDALWVELKVGEDFEVRSETSHGKFFDQTKEIVFPLGPISSQEIDVLVQMNGPRMVLSFTPDAGVLKTRWVGAGGYQGEKDFVRVQK